MHSADVEWHVPAAEGSRTYMCSLQVSEDNPFASWRTIPVPARATSSARALWTYRVEGLSQGYRYLCRVRAHNAVGYSESFSKVCKFDTLDVPAAPVQVRCVGTSRTVFRLECTCMTPGPWPSKACPSRSWRCAW